jgi:hypothetical protein
LKPEWWGSPLAQPVTRNDDDDDNNNKGSLASKLFGCPKIYMADLGGLAV